MCVSRSLNSDWRPVKQREVDVTQRSQSLPGNNNSNKPESWRDTNTKIIKVNSCFVSEDGRSHPGVLSPAQREFLPELNCVTTDRSPESKRLKAKEECDKQMRRKKTTADCLSLQRCNNWFSLNKLYWVCERVRVRIELVRRKLIKSTNSSCFKLRLMLK